jgi:hypothetical protein
MPEMLSEPEVTVLRTSVGDLDTHDFGPPGTRSLSQILPFSHKGLERTEMMFAK